MSHLWGLRLGHPDSPGIRLSSLKSSNFNHICKVPFAINVTCPQILGINCGYRWLGRALFLSTPQRMPCSPQTHALNHYALSGLECNAVFCKRSLPHGPLLCPLSKAFTRKEMNSWEKLFLYQTQGHARCLALNRLSRNVLKWNHTNYWHLLNMYNVPDTVLQLYPDYLIHFTTIPRTEDMSVVAVLLLRKTKVLIRDFARNHIAQ